MAAGCGGAAACATENALVNDDDLLTGWTTSNSTQVVM
jgi:hypothetical protein